MTRHQLPNAEDAERAVLGAVLACNELFRELIATLAEQDFYSPRHRLIFQALQSLFTKGEALDPLGLHDELGEHNPQAGGVEYYFQLADHAPGTDSFHYLMHRIAEQSIRRRVIQGGADLMDKAHDPDVEAARVVDALARLTVSLTRRLAPGRRTGMPDGMLGVFADLEKRLANPGKAGGLRTRFTDLTRMLEGLHRGGLLVVAGRPATGKTSLATNVASDTLRLQSTPVLFFSLQLDSQTLLQRMLCAEAKVGSKHFLRGTLDDEELKRLTEAGERLARTSLEIDDSPGASIEHIRRTAAGWASQLRKSAGTDALPDDRPLGLVVVDGLGLVQVHGRATEFDGLTEVTRQLKHLARETDLLVLATCQLTESDEEARTDVPPTIRHLQRTANVEEASDMVILLHRDRADAEGVVYVQVAKSHNGRIGAFELYWLGKQLRFDNLSEQFDDETSMNSRLERAQAWESV